MKCLIHIYSTTPMQIGCAFVAGLLHYFFLASFCWMLCEGVMLYLMMVVVFSKLSKKWWFYLLLGWGECSYRYNNKKHASCNGTIATLLFSLNDILLQLLPSCLWGLQ